MAMDDFGNKLTTIEDVREALDRSDKERRTTEHMLRRHVEYAHTLKTWSDEQQKLQPSRMKLGRSPTDEEIRADLARRQRIRSGIAYIADGKIFGVPRETYRIDDAFADLE